MPIAAASDALVRHLHARLEEAGALEGLTIETMNLPEARANPGHGVALVLWRVQPDEPAGDTSPLRTASEGDPPDGGGLKLVPGGRWSIKTRPRFPGVGANPDIAGGS